VLNNPDLAALDREFASSKTMRVETWSARRAEILARAPDSVRTPRPSPTLPAAPDDPYVTRGFFENVLSPLVKGIGSAMRKFNTEQRDYFDTRIKALEERSQLAYGGAGADGPRSGDELTVAIGRALDPLGSRLAAVETRCAALAMMVARGPEAKNLQEVEATLEPLLKTQRGLLARLDAQANKIAELESRPTMKYVGVWSADEQCVEGEFCTHSGSLWACRATTRSRPGTDETWQLAAKRGNDGKDLR
jgi:hypothetical protein